jgi:cytochrome c553
MTKDAPANLRRKGNERTLRGMRIVLLALMFGAMCSGRSIGEAGEPLVWESPSQFYTAKPGDVSAKFTFKVVNVSGAEVVIDDVKTSCGCTTAELPSKPWRLAAGETNKMEVLIDLRDKVGKLLKTMTVESAKAPKTLTVLLDIPPEASTARLPAGVANRMFGQQLGALDHQAVFKKDCVKCHLEPAFGKTGESLFHAVCGICHEGKSRASMVPDLATLKAPIDDDYWENWVAHGKAGSLMPGFAASEGGPLSDGQIASLVKYLTTAFPRPIQNPRPQPEDGD